MTCARLGNMLLPCLFSVLPVTLHNLLPTAKACSINGKVVVPLSHIVFTQLRQTHGEVVGSLFSTFNTNLFQIQLAVFVVVLTLFNTRPQVRSCFEPESYAGGDCHQKEETIRYRLKFLLYTGLLIKKSNSPPTKWSSCKSCMASMDEIPCLVACTMVYQPHVCIHLWIESDVNTYMDDSSSWCITHHPQFSSIHPWYIISVLCGQYTCDPLAWLLV